MHGTTYLRVKIKSLAAEARIIRTEERRSKAARTFDRTMALAEHRRGVVRREARAALLAYGFLRGRSLDAIEPKRSRPIDAKRVGALVARYGEPGSVDRLAGWLRSPL